MLCKIAAVVCAGLCVVALAGCGSGSAPASASRTVDEQAIAGELARELPGFEQSPAFRLEVLNVVDLCRSSTIDFGIGASYAGSAEEKVHLRRQIRAGCPWRSSELEHLLARRNEGTNRS